MEIRLAELADAIGAELVGEPTAIVSGVADLAAATPRDLVFADNAAALGRALASRAGAVICAARPADDANPTPALLLVRTPRLAFARAVRLFFDVAPPTGRVHPSAVVAASARLGELVDVGPHAVIGDDVVIGDRTRIGPNVNVSDRVRLGADCELKPGVVLYPGTIVGSRVLIHAGAVLGSDGFGFVRDEATGAYEKFPQVGWLEVGDDVEIGANTTIDRGALGATVIADGTKLDNLVQVAHNVKIGRHVAVSAQTGIAGSSVIEDKVVVAGQVGIADHVRIESGAILGAQCGVPTGKVLRGPGVVFWGTPARPLKEYLRELAVLARLAKRGR